MCCVHDTLVSQERPPGGLSVGHEALIISMSFQNNLLLDMNIYAFFSVHDTLIQVLPPSPFLPSFVIQEASCLKWPLLTFINGSGPPPTLPSFTFSSFPAFPTSTSTYHHLHQTRSTTLGFSTLEDTGLCPHHVFHRRAGQQKANETQGLVTRTWHFLTAKAGGWHKKKAVSNN